MNSAAHSHRSALFLLMSCVGSLAFALILPFMVDARSKPFHDAPLREMEKIQPDYVFIGNSMCESRIGARHLSELSGEKAYRIVSGPSFIPTWYIWLKNFVAAAKIKPKKVFMFFTDEQLTATEFEVVPRDAEFIESELTFYEPVYDRLIRKKAGSFYQKIIDRIRRFYFRSEIQDPARQAFSNFIMRLSSAASYEQTRQEINLYLKTAGRRPAFDVVHEQDFHPRDVPMTSTEAFSLALTKSFLDPMVQVAKEYKVPVCFFRIRRAPLLRREDDPKFIEYKRELKAYFERNNICYIDESGDTDVTDDYYASPSDDHVVKGAQYTEMFFRKYIKDHAS
jgi:hypothetical protein